MRLCRVLILGGYGNFGKRIAESLAAVEGATIIIAGRNIKKARQFCEALSLKNTCIDLQPATIDIDSSEFAYELKALSPDILIHTSGPFQGQDYRVPEACIAAGCHYIDLADDRRFVCDITTLDDTAKKSDLLIVSGASSVPGLSSVVIDQLAREFFQLDTIDFAIAPGNRAERGIATVKGILSYVGHPFTVFDQGKWSTLYGWMSPRKMNFGEGVGARWLANVDIPDLELFPKRYSPVKTVRFQAGLELSFLHFGLVFMALLAKAGLIKDWSAYVKQIFKLSEIFKGLGSDTGGMKICLSGVDADQTPKNLNWTLYAPDGEGPYIPTLSAIILAKKLIGGTIHMRGAKPCLGMYTVAEFDKEASSLGIYHKLENGYG